MVYKLAKKYVIKYFHIYFGLLFFISFLYQVPYADWNISTVIKFKRVMFVLLLVAMILAIDWRRIKYSLFFWCCLIWAAAHGGGWAIHEINFDLYLTRIIQVLFIYIFVVFLSQQQHKLNYFWVEKWFKPPLLSLVITVILFTAYFDDLLVSGIHSGFGGNRVNFSIWLGQVVFLYLVLFLRERPGAQGKLHVGSRRMVVFLKALVLVTPVIGLQVFTAGRIGLMATSIMCLYFSILLLGVRWGTALALAYLVIVISFFGAISPISSQHHGADLLRGVSALGASRVPGITTPFDEPGITTPVGVLWEWFDRASSYRLSILASGLNAITPSVFFVGLGVGNFSVWLPNGDVWPMHNIFVNHLAELGIVGLIPLICIVFMPFLQSRATPLDQFIRAFCLLWLVIALLQPELILSQISTSLIYWTAFAYQLKGYISR